MSRGGCEGIAVAKAYRRSDKVSIIDSVLLWLAKAYSTRTSLKKLTQEREGKRPKQEGEKKSEDNEGGTPKGKVVYEAVRCKQVKALWRSRKFLYGYVFCVCEWGSTRKEKEKEERKKEREEGRLNSRG